MFDHEIEFLKRHKISRVIALTESHHQKDFLEKHFELHHLSIVDLTAPTIDQVMKLAELIEDSRQKKLKIAVHCMAGVGRTSTMLVASHLAMGEDLASLKSLLAKQNPAFKLTTTQMDFLGAFSGDTSAG